MATKTSHDFVFAIPGNNYRLLESNCFTEITYIELLETCIGEIDDFYCTEGDISYDTLQESCAPWYLVTDERVHQPEATTACQERFGTGLWCPTDDDDDVDSDLLNALLYWQTIQLNPRRFWMGIVYDHSVNDYVCTRADEGYDYENYIWDSVATGFTWFFNWAGFWYYDICVYYVWQSSTKYGTPS